MFDSSLGIHYCYKTIFLSTLIKQEKKIFLIHKEIHMRSGKKSYIYEEGLPNTVYEEMRKYLTIYEEGISHIGLTLHPIHSEFPYI